MKEKERIKYEFQKLPDLEIQSLCQIPKSYLTLKKEGENKYFLWSTLFLCKETRTFSFF